MSGLVNALACTAAAAWAAFVLWYQLRARWWVTPEGRNVMAVSVAIVTLMMLAALARLAPDWAGRPYAQVVVYGSLAVLGVQRIVQMERAQRGYGCPNGPEGGGNVSDHSSQ